MFFLLLYRKQYVNIYIDMYSSLQAHFKMNSHVNVSNNPSVSISFLIGGLNNEYLFLKPRIHELMSS